MSQSQFMESNALNIHGEEREKILRKIKSCLALSQSSNPNEAETAMRQAQAMMRKYKLSEVDVVVEEVSSEMRPTGLSRLPEWQRRLAHTCALAFGCQLIMRRSFKIDRRGPVEFVFIGIMPSAELAAYAYDALLAQLKTARKEFAKKFTATRKLADDFCFAWVRAVYEKVVGFAKDNQPESSSERNALLVIESREQAAINEWISRMFGKPEVRKQVVRKVDALAYQLGLASGASANLHQAVAGQREGQLRIA